ncbi:MAG: DUF5110 domain-containing protein [Anaerolineae bacterium]|nr:DUF5110 domain-containing protein [Anaerolineae bacterium]
MTTHDAADLYERIRFRGNPVAHEDAMVVCGKARFTFLTPRMVRMEWSETGAFEDRGTYAFPTRYTPDPPPLQIERDASGLCVDTGALRLCYLRSDGPFDAANLSIAMDLDGERAVWTPGMPAPANLRGTRRTLDGCAGDAALGEGLLSRAGWSVFDDSASVVFEPDDGWVAPRPEHALSDWTLFAYGHDYAGALQDYTRFGGAIPLIPRFVLGAWWSRYWAYSAQDLMDLVGDFERHDLPLDVLVIDMDWHTPVTWTGYTWNRELFPDPAAFLSWVHDKGLRATLNLHPAQGIQAHEAVYAQFARAMGMDPESGEPVPFRITDKRFVRHYFELLHHPMEDEGVDFWWIDWQQGEGSEMRGLDPLPWLNHLHFHDSTRRGGRPMLYSRWGGLGNHRYYIGFSGDTIVGWPALQFQPYLTATASNVCYGWWSHDIGGHMGGATEPELYARWVQFGALSPCLRLHSTKDPTAERRPWAYPDPVYRAARAAFHLRYQLVPYLYTMARVASETSISLCRPMYYAHPEAEAAYVARYQYYLGDELIAAPIVHPADPATGMASTDVWVPDGTWIDYQTKETYSGPRWVRVVGDLDRVPLLARAGAIVPLASSYHDPAGTGMRSGATDDIPSDPIVLQVFPGAAGTFRLYEDDGVSTAYQQGAFEWTAIETEIDADRAWTVRVAPAEGHCAALAPERGYVIHLEGSRQPEAVTIDGEGSRDWAYNPETLTTTIRVAARDRRQGVEVTAWNPNGISALGEAHNRACARGDAWRLLGSEWPAGAGGDASSAAAADAVLRTALPGRADAVARLGGPFARVIEYVTPEEAAGQLGRVIVGAPASPEQRYDVRVTFDLYRGGAHERHTVDHAGCSEAQIIATPFAFDGSVASARWEAEVELRWRGQTLSLTHHSQPIFPTVYAWRALVYNREQTPLSLREVTNTDGTIDASLGWTPHRQTAEGLANINEPHAILFSRAYRERLQAGEPLAAYVATTVTSPDDREAVLAYMAGGEVSFTLNGEPVAEAARDQGTAHPFVRQLRTTEPFRLRAGANTLLVATQPPTEGRPFWFLGAGFRASGTDDVPMTDLAFS